jgi:predicted NBD/HSP70 family sugar kinase
MIQSITLGSGVDLTTVQTGPQPADFAGVRATNLTVVLRHVHANAPCSRADIAASTGLNKATVSSLVAELIERRLLRETGLVEHRVGRPATMIVLDGSPYAAVGIDVDADHLTVEAVDLAGERVLSWRRAFPSLAVSPSRAVSSIVSLARRAVARVNDDGRQVLGVTAGVPGLVDSAGVISSASSLGWQNLDLRGELLRGLNEPTFPVLVENDANLAVLAEYRFGGYEGATNLVHLNGEAGIGAGILADGRPLRGAMGYAGEIGHLPVEVDGPECPCGRRGCLEAVAGIPALIRRLDPDAYRNGPISDFEPEVTRIVERATSQDQAALTALQEAGKHLGYAVAALVNLVNPEVVILGGYYVPLAPWLLPAAEAELRARVVAPEAGGCRLAVSTLGHGAAALGGTARILDAIDAGQLPRPTP